jgi:hypothetical protein
VRRCRIKIASVDEPVLRNITRSIRPDEIGSNRIRELIESMRGDVMAAGVYGIPYPSEGAVVEPDTLIVTLLASTRRAIAWVMVAVSMIEHLLIPGNTYIQSVWALKMQG